jgi:predicted O-methyltransferase YrrM
MTETELIPLPGTPYSRYALPLEYPPSRDMRARWGYSRPLIPSLHSWFASYADDYRAFISEMRTFGADLRDVAHTFDPALLPAPAWMGTAMNPIDSLALYTFVRKRRPATYLEIGSGITTCFAHLARQHGRLSTKIISIDPEPRVGVDTICDTIVRDGLETCDLAIFETLGPGDIVFLDGSHRVFMNSDVTVFFIDVLPMLKPGVVVHIHDIALPWDYHQYFAHWYWSEQYMLAVYMMASKQRLKPLFPGAFVTADPDLANEFAKPLIDLSFRTPLGRRRVDVVHTHFQLEDEVDRRSPSRGTFLGIAPGIIVGFRLSRRRLRLT